MERPRVEACQVDTVNTSHHTSTVTGWPGNSDGGAEMQCCRARHQGSRKDGWNRRALKGGDDQTWVQTDILRRRKMRPPQVGNPLTTVQDSGLVSH